jgi:hypothetical protein
MHRAVLLKLSALRRKATLGFGRPPDHDFEALAFGKAGKPFMISSPVLVSRVVKRHSKPGARAEDARHRAKQVHGCELHAQTQPCASAPRDQVLVERPPLLLRIPATWQKLQRPFKYGGVVVHVLAGRGDACLYILCERL